MTAPVWTPIPEDEIPAPEQVLAVLDPAPGEPSSGYITPEDLQYAWDAFLSQEHWTAGAAGDASSAASAAQAAATAAQGSATAAGSAAAAAQATANSALSLAQANQAALPKFIRKTADAPTRSNTAVFATDPELTLSLPIGRYRILAQLIYSADPAADLKIGWIGPAGTTLAWGLAAASTALASGLGTGLWKSYVLADPVAIGGDGAAVLTSAIIAGILNLTAAGSFALQWAQNTAGATNVIVRASSWIEARPVA